MDVEFVWYARLALSWVGEGAHTCKDEGHAVVHGVWLARLSALDEYHITFRLCGECLDLLHWSGTVAPEVHSGRLSVAIGLETGGKHEYRRSILAEKIRTTFPPVCM